MDNATGASSVQPMPSPYRKPHVEAPALGPMNLPNPTPAPTKPLLTLTDFLLARIAEDESAAHRVDSIPRDGLPPMALEQVDQRAARMLAEVEAKRRIVEWDAEQPVDRGVLNILASVYADHPDYREEWRP